MKKGIVMEISHEYITMLTPEGEFIKARNHHNNYQIGEEIDFFPVSEQSSRLSKRQRFYLSKSKLAWISSCAVILLLLSFIPLAFQNKVYAYMSIDINPSFEIGLDHKLNVISIEALNDDGTTILNTIDDWKQQHVDVVTELILEKSRERGYLETGEEVIITTVINDNDENELKQLLQKDLEDISSTYEQEEILITSIESNEETRSKAKNQGISTGKLLQLEKKIIVEKESSNKDNNVDIQHDDSSNNSQNKQIDVEIINGENDANIKPKQQPTQSNIKKEEDEEKKKDKNVQVEQKKAKNIEKPKNQMNQGKSTNQGKPKIQEKKEEIREKKNEKMKQINEKKDQVKEKVQETKRQVKEKKEQIKEKVDEKRSNSKMPENVRRILEQRAQEKHSISNYFWK